MLGQHGRGLTRALFTRPALAMARAGITPNTLNTRLRDLRAAGFITHGSDGYSLTPSGQDLFKRLSDLQAFAVRWVASQSKKK